MHECLWQFAAVFRHLPCWCCRRELLAWAEPTLSTQEAKFKFKSHCPASWGIQVRPIHEEQICQCPEQGESVDQAGLPQLKDCNNL